MDLPLFRRIEAELQSQPDVRHDIEDTLAKIVPPTSSDPEAFWSNMWQKPIYAYNKISSANLKIQLLAGKMPQRWVSMGQSGSDFIVTRLASGMRSTSFEVSGSFGEDLRLTHRIAPHRLFAIQSAARVLRDRTLSNTKGLFSDLENMSIENMVIQLRSELRDFWGPITTLHLLTDMGLASKPDLHVVNTVARLGGPARPGVVPSEREAVAISQFVHDLTEQAYGTVTPEALRRVDLLLLHADMKREVWVNDRSGSAREMCRARY